MKGTPSTFTWPQKKIDPRIFQCAALGFYSITAPLVSGFERPQIFTFYILIYSIALDALIGRLVFKKVNFPYTPLVISFACSLILDSPYLYIYLFAATAGILTKAFLVYNGRHFLNPANSAVVFALLAFPLSAAGIPRLFNISPVYIAVFFGVGFFVSAYAGSLSISVLWLAWFSICAVLRSWITGADLVFCFLPMLAPTFFLFTFHMITDPATIPRRLSHKVIYTGAVALFDAWLRMRQIPFSNLYSLLFICSAMPLLGATTLFTVRSFAPVACFVVALSVFSWRQISFSQRLEQNPVYTPPIPPAYNSSLNDHFEQLFVQAQNEMGVHFKSIDPDVDPLLDKELRIQWVAPGVAVADFNHDGYMDFFMPNSNSSKSKNSLFLNQKGQGFIDAAEEWNIAQVPRDQISQSATPIDLNNDGLMDLIVSGPGCVHVYENQKTKFKDETEKYGLKDCENSIVALPVDINEDGILDIYLARFFSKRINLFDLKGDMRWFGPDNFSRSMNGGVNTWYVFREGKFSIDPTIPEETRGAWTWDVGLADIRNKNEKILVIGNDFGDDFYYQLGKGTWTEITDEITIRESRAGMNVSFGDFGKPFPQIIMTNIQMDSFDARGNYVWEYDPKTNQLVDQQDRRGVGECGWAWGVAFGDFNLDGLQDVYTSNGMVTKPTSDPTHGDKNYFKRSVIANVPPEAWQSNQGSVFKFLDLKDGLGGAQRDCLFMRSSQSEKYENITKKTPAIEPWDGRAVAIIDRANNGVLDLIVTTQGSEVRYLRNTTPPSQKWIGLQLDAHPALTMGAKIRIQQGKKTQRSWHQNGKSGFLAFSDPRVHFGLANEKDPVDVFITWSNGEETAIPRLQPGQYYQVKSK